MSRAVKSIKFGKHVLTFDFNALVEAEEHVGPLSRLVTDPHRAASFKTVRALIWAGLLAENPDITLKEAGDICQEVGVEQSANAVKEALVKAYGVQEDDEVEGEPGKS